MFYLLSEITWESRFNYSLSQILKITNILENSNPLYYSDCFIESLGKLELITISQISK